MLKRVPIHRSANRINLFLGGDRELVMCSGLLAATLIFAPMDWRAAIVGVVFWMASLKIFRALAKSDPLLRSVYLRHRKYAGYYPAYSTPFRKNSNSKKGSKPY